MELLKDIDIKSVLTFVFSVGLFYGWIRSRLNALTTNMSDMKAFISKQENETKTAMTSHKNNVKLAIKEQNEKIDKVEDKHNELNTQLARIEERQMNTNSALEDIKKLLSK